ncbi:hypothetical protein H312_01258 [Anncaliia algerae PRA339]|uniref:Kinesin-like protein n=1 Tax=Anncaliia algerae PRA339 TaxID=1288291 RepID=A0A059F324_9MICR|nr:hypothetical protein H312_01258 [Anncaliia algerae PRA339]
MENENIKVFLRIRPNTIINDEYKINNDTIMVQNNTFCFDKIFYNSSQQDIYVHLANKFIVESMQGYNSVIFAYGQTGSGKTHTIQGNFIDRGLIPRTLGYLFNSKESIKVSFLEIYNEQLFDLFNISNQVSLREDPFKGVYAENLTELEFDTYEESMKHYSLAIQNRRTASTAMNRHSSRSHSIFTISIHKKNFSNRSKIIFVDLAGSEKLKTNSEIRKAETCNINKSLLCLGEVIKKLSKKENHINYRDSKLTFLLRDALAGDSKLAVIGTIHLNSKYIKESFNTLKFISRVKNIKNNPTLNNNLGENIEELKSKILTLDKENQQLKMTLYLNKEKMNVENNKNTNTSIIIYKSMIYKCTNLIKKLKNEFLELRNDLIILSKYKYDKKIELLSEIAENQKKILNDFEKQINDFDIENENFEL